MIDHQTKFNNSQKVIHIVGISGNTKKLISPNGQTLKFSIQNKMHGVTHLIKDVVPTNKTNSEGCWNVLVDNEDFDQAVHTLNAHMLKDCTCNKTYKSNEFYTHWINY